MKTKEQLYDYCKKNQHTKNWCLSLENFAMKKMEEWELATDRCDNIYPVNVKLNWQIGIELFAILNNKCREVVNYTDALWVADRICQDIGKKLTQILALHQKPFCVVKFRANYKDEAVMYLGPNIEKFCQMFSDDGILVTRGYDCFMNAVALTKNAEEYYQKISRSGLKFNRNSKIFISHSSADVKYAEALVALFERIGIQEREIFCSSVPGYGVPNGENIHTYLAHQFSDYNLKLYYLLSENYYTSTDSMNEMGAAWIQKNEYSLILLPGFEFEQIKGFIDRYKAGIKLDASIIEVRSRLGQEKDSLINTFHLPSLSMDKWERIRDEFIEKVR